MCPPAKDGQTVTDKPAGKEALLKEMPLLTIAADQKPGLSGAVWYYKESNFKNGPILAIFLVA